MAGGGYGGSDRIDSSPDNGYQSICPHCAGRHNFSDEVIGKERWLRFQNCGGCVEKQAAMVQMKKARALYPVGSDKWRGPT